MDTLGEGRRFDECLKRVGYSETNTSQIYLSMQFGSFEKACASIGRVSNQEAKQQKKMQQMMISRISFTFVIGMVLCIRMLLPTNFPAWCKKNNSSSLASFIDMAGVSKLTTAGNGFLMIVVTLVLLIACTGKGRTPMISFAC